MRDDFDALPSSPAVEKTVLASVMLGSLDPETVLPLLTDDDFALESHRRVLRCMRDLLERGKPIDRVQLVESAREHNYQDITLGFVVDMDSDVPQLDNAEPYLDSLREKATLRRVARSALQLANRCCTPGEDVRQILSDSERIIQACSDRLAKRVEWLSPGEIMHGVPGGINAFLMPPKSGMGVPTPWEFLTAQTCGWHAGELLLVAGRPSMGKSVIAMQCAYAAAVAGYGVGFFSLEMTKESLVQRMIASVGSVDAQSLRSGTMDEATRRAAARAAGEIAELPIRIDDTRANTIPAIMAGVRKLQASMPVGLVIIDHMQLMQGVRSYSSKHHELSEISHAMKRAAVEFGCPVMLLSQLSRDCEKDKRVPVLADLKETGSLEEDADVVLFVHRPEMYWRDKRELRGQAKIILAKQRNGPTGSKALVFQHRYQRFLDLGSEQSDD